MPREMDAHPNLSNAGRIFHPHPPTNLLLPSAEKSTVTKRSRWAVNNNLDRKLSVGITNGHRSFTPPRNVGTRVGRSWKDHDGPPHVSYFHQAKVMERMVHIARDSITWPSKTFQRALSV